MAGTTRKLHGPSRRAYRGARRDTAQVFKNEGELFRSRHRRRDIKETERQLLQLLRQAERDSLSRQLSLSLADLLAVTPASTLLPEVTSAAAEHAAVLTRRFSEDLVKHLQRHPETILSLPGDIFEELVAELLAGLGFEELNLRVRTDAGEADILGFSKDILGHRVGYLFELKQHGRSGRLVELREVTRLFGLRESLRLRLGVDQGIFVTTTSYTRPAKEFAAIHALSLKEFSDVESWLLEYSGQSSGLYMRQN